MSQTQSFTARSPATVSNLGSGFDILGCAVEGAYDTVSASLENSVGVRVVSTGHPDITTDPTRHTAAVAVAAVLRRLGREELGVKLTCTKGIPLSGGQGGSAASAVAGALAINRLLGDPLDDRGLLECSLVAEERVAGRHADNLAPCLLGGIVLVRSLDPVDIVSLAAPEDLRIVVAHPHYRVNTREARAVLPDSFSRDALVYQAAQLGALVSALAAGNYDLISRSMDDIVAVPHRTALLPGFEAARDAALQAGALGSSISGSGPTSFALVRGDGVGARVAAAMRDAYQAAGHECDARCSRIGQGASII